MPPILADVFVTPAVVRNKAKGMPMKLIVAATLLGSLIAGTSFANAMPLAPAGQGGNADVIKVAGGCGPGFHRGPYGGCRPNRGAVVVVPPRRYIAPAPYVRRCPPGTFMGRYGRCRPY